MKKISVLLVLLSLCYISKAQKAGTSHVGIGVEAGIPLGENGKPYSIVLGGNLQYETLPSADLGITLSAGYLQWPLKSSYGDGSVGFVPLLAGIKYYFTPNAFFRAALGAAVGTKTEQGTSFAYTPGIGVKLSPNIDAELKYLGISNKGGTLETVGARLGFNF